MDTLIDAVLDVVASVERRVMARIEALDARALPPGPPGPPGDPGVAGKDGRDGVDGIGFEDVAVAFDGERTITLRFARGDRERAFPIKLIGLMVYRGVFDANRPYEVGDTVTWAGSLWVAKADTTSKPGIDATWQLSAKRGQEGRAGRDAKDSTR